MANFNKVLLLGNLTRDIEMRSTASGVSIAKFGMAVNRKYKKGDETVESTCFVDLTAWGKQADVLNQYTGKGSPLFVEGRLEYSTWEAEGGKKRSKLEVVVENFQLIGGGGRGSGSGATAGATTGGGDKADFDNIPF